VPALRGSGGGELAPVGPGLGAHGDDQPSERPLVDDLGGGAVLEDLDEDGTDPPGSRPGDQGVDPRSVRRDRRRGLRRGPPARARGRPL